MTVAAAGSTALHAAEYELRSREDAAWLRELREGSMARFLELGFPGRRQEEWRHTDVAPLARTEFTYPRARAAIDARSLEAAALAGLSPYRAVFVDGRFVPELSTAGPEVVSLAKGLADRPHDLRGRLGSVATDPRHPFAALNTALFEDGALVILPRGSGAREPLHLYFVTTRHDAPVVTHPRVLVLAEPGSEATVVEEFLGFGEVPSFTNSVVEVLVSEEAVVRHVKVQRERDRAYHMATLAAQVGRAARFETHSLSLGASRARSDVIVRLAAEGSECSLNGLSVTGGEQLADHHTTVDHESPHTTSRQLYKGILDDESRCVFHGRVIVRPGASKTDAEQSNKNLVLSDAALVNSDPQLEIFASDVKCKHGSGIGPVSGDELYYLRSRGIAREAARELLITAFAGEMVERVPVPALRAALGPEVAARLVRRGRDA